MSRRTVILLALLLGLAPGLGADALSQAVVLALHGKASYSRKGSKVEYPLALGQRLDEGVTLRTGVGGGLRLRLADGSTLGICPNSSITLGSSQQRRDKRSTLNLLQGLVRWVIQQTGSESAQGVSYEIDTDNAVAAVKGTDFSAQDVGGSLDVKVYSSQHEGVQVGDPDGSNQSLAAPGQELLRQDDGTLLSRSLGKDDYAALAQTWPDLPAVKPPAGLPDHAGGFQKAVPLPPSVGGGGRKGSPSGNAGGGAGQTPAPGSNSGGSAGEPTPGPGGGSTAPTPAPDSGTGVVPTPAPNPAPSAADIVQGIQDQVQDLRQDIGVNKSLDQQTKSHDLYSGAAFIDRNGYMVQVASLILPNQPANVVDKVITSKRTDGPDTGVSVFSDKYTYNQALPSDWTSVVGQSLNAISNIGANGAPIYYLLQQDVTLLSPAGCAACLSTVYTGPGGSAAPVQLLNGVWSQSYTNYYTIAGQTLAHASWAPNASGNGFTQTGGNLINVAPVLKPDGSWSFTYSYLPTGGSTYQTMFQANVWILDGLGGTVPGQLGSPSSLSNLQLLDSGTVAELQLTSALFNGGDVDVLLEEPDLVAAFP
jgi:hypothetical protein